jgi:hypothetical protein
VVTQGMVAMQHLCMVASWSHRLLLMENLIDVLQLPMCTVLQYVEPQYIAS